MRAALDRRYRVAGHDQRADRQASRSKSFDIILRGGLGKDAAIGKPILRRVPSPLVEDYVSRLFAGYLDSAPPSETFTHFCVRTAGRRFDRDRSERRRQPPQSRGSARPQGLIMARNAFNEEAKRPN